MLLFVIPSGEASRTPLLSWEDTRRMPWDILLLFGGGLTLAGQLSEAGVLSVVAEALASMPSLSPAWLIAGFVLMSLFLTEVMSNLALTVVLVPVVAQVALAWGMDPLLLVVPVTMASSCAFMLLMATPPMPLSSAVANFAWPPWFKWVWCSMWWQLGLRGCGR